MKTLEKNKDNLSAEDFDEYGFAAVEKKYYPQIKAGMHVFHTQNPENNLKINFYSGHISSSNVVMLQIFQTEQDFDAEFDALAGKNIVETITYLLKAHPQQTRAIMTAMPTSLYENEAVTLQILSCVKRTDDVIHDATTAIAKKMELLKTYQQMQTPKSTNQQFNDMVENYKQEKQQLDEGKIN